MKILVYCKTTAHLVGKFIEASVLASHEDAASVGAGNVHDVGVVCGDGEQGLWQQVHFIIVWVVRGKWSKTTHRLTVDLFSYFLHSLAIKPLSYKTVFKWILESEV